ncbi:MAG: TonB-dependent receptor [Flavobacteriales bacterium]
MIRVLKVSLMLSLVLLTVQAQAQQKMLSGTVVDEKGEPLAGVNIVIEGTHRGTATDFDGKYTIEASPGQKLTFSYLGYQSVSRSVGESNILNIRLYPVSRELAEVVAVAYGTRKKGELIGSVVSIDAETLQKQQTTDITTAIQGNVPGVTVIQSGGQPGSNPIIRIRGIASINASASPLVIVNGVPYNGNLNNISDNEVESMNILKDAAATAPYGSRGANGVILITTKRGRLNSPPQVSVRVSQGLSDPAVSFHKVLGAGQYMEYFWEAMRNEELYIGDSKLKPGTATKAQKAKAAQTATDGLISTLGYNPYGTLEKPVGTDGKTVSGAALLWDTDWKKAVLSDQAFRKDYQLNISGGGQQTTYALSGSYLKQDGSVISSNFERFTTRLDLTSQVKDWLQIGLNTNLTNSYQNNPTQGGGANRNPMLWIYNMPSVYPVYKRNPSGQLIYDDKGNKIFDYGDGKEGELNARRETFTMYNPLGNLYDDDIKYSRSNTDINGFAAIDLLKELQFKTQLSYAQYLFDVKQYYNSEHGDAAKVHGRVTKRRDIYKTLDFTNSINYKKQFGNHNLEGQALMEVYDLYYDRLTAAGEGFLPGVKALSSSTKPTQASGSPVEDRLVSYMVRALYNYNSKYVVEASFRRDGSTRFAPDTRWGNFYAVGVSYLLSQEPFIQRIDWIDVLKLKTSYGELGNNTTLLSNGSKWYFPYLAAYSTGFSQLDHPGVIQSGAVDPNLKWEKTASFNAGVEFGLWKDRLSGSFEYYNKKSIDLIYEKPLPLSGGITSLTTNVGALRNYGYEVSLHSVNLRNPNLEWRTGINFSIDRNEIVELTQKEFISGSKKWKVGRSLYDFFIREYAGVDPDDGYAMWYKDVLDQEGKPTGKREKTKQYDEATRYYQNKRSIPDIQGGFNTEFKYKNFDLYALFNFSWGGYVYDDSYAGLMSSLKSAAQGSPDLARRWQKKGDVTDVPLLLDSENQFTSTSTRFLFKNNYIRLKAINLAYNLPEDFVRDMGLSTLRFYLQGDNLWTYQSHKGIDPEQGNKYANPEQNLNGMTNHQSYPLRTISVGLNIEF